jgi:hypothetical protein
MTPESDDDRFRDRTPAEKLRLAERLYWSARAVKRAMLKKRHPQATDEELDRRVRDAFLHART